MKQRLCKQCRSWHRKIDHHWQFDSDCTFPELDEETKETFRGLYLANKTIVDNTSYARFKIHSQHRNELEMIHDLLEDWSGGVERKADNNYQIESIGHPFVTDLKEKELSKLEIKSPVPWAILYTLCGFTNSNGIKFIHTKPDELQELLGDYGISTTVYTINEFQSNITIPVKQSFDFLDMAGLSPHQSGMFEDERSEKTQQTA